MITFSYIFIHELNLFLGPSIGSALYKIGGFGVPFWTMGSIGFISVTLIIITLPPVNQANINCQSSSRSLTIREVFKVCLSEKISFLLRRISKDCLFYIFQSPLILLPLYDNFMVTSGVGFLEGMLELHMMKTVAEATQDHVGNAFLILGGAYLITTVFAGWVNNVERQK